MVPQVNEGGGKSDVPPDLPPTVAFSSETPEYNL